MRFLATCRSFLAYSSMRMCVGQRRSFKIEQTAAHATHGCRGLEWLVCGLAKAILALGPAHGPCGACTTRSRQLRPTLWARGLGRCLGPLKEDRPIVLYLPQFVVGQYFLRSRHSCAGCMKVQQPPIIPVPQPSKSCIHKFTLGTATSLCTHAGRSGSTAGREPSVCPGPAAWQLLQECSFSLRVVHMQAAQVRRGVNRQSANR